MHEAPAEDLPFADDYFDTAMAQLVVAFMADAPAAMRELSRVARTVAVCMWGVQEMQMFAAIEATAKAVGVDRGEQGARRYRTLAELVELLEGAGIGEVETAELDVVAPYEDFADFWHALEGQVGPAGAWLQAMDGEQREAARAELHRQLGSPEASFTLTGRAYAVKATR